VSDRETSEESGSPSGQLSAVPSERQLATIRQLELEEICFGQMVAEEGRCGWIRIVDRSRNLEATVDRSGTLLRLEGPGRSGSRRIGDQLPGCASPVDLRLETSAALPPNEGSDLKTGDSSVQQSG
jgi:hypothetical protein